MTKKLLFISKNMDFGGMEKALVVLLNNLTKHYDITLILEEKKGPLLVDLDKKVKVVEYSLSKNQNILVRKFKNLIHKTIWKWQNHNKYDFACNYATYSLIGSYLARVASTNNALYVHNDYYELFQHNLDSFKTFFNNLNVQGFKNIFFVSNESKASFDLIYQNLKQKTKVINNLCDYDNIKQLSCEKTDIPFNKEDTNFLFIGRLDNKQKNLQRMIEAINIALKKNKKIKLFMIGDGPDKSLCEKLIKKYDISNNVILLGSKKNPYPYLKKSDAFLLTSNYEGYPVVLTESLILNKKIISTISMSDGEIDLAKYIIKTNFNEKEIAQEILKLKKEKIDYKIDFKKINENRIKKLIRIIEED